MEPTAQKQKLVASAENRLYANMSVYILMQWLLGRQINTPGDNYGCPTIRNDTGVAGASVLVLSQYINDDIDYAHCGEACVKRRAI